jgi:hypothetical protein
LRERELCLKLDLVAIPGYFGHWLADGQVLPCQVRDVQTVAVPTRILVCTRYPCQVGLENKRLVLWLDVQATRATEHTEGREDGDVDLAHVEWAAVHKALQGAEGKWRDRGGEEGLLARLEAQEGPVPAVLLALLAYDRRHSADRAGIAVGGQQLRGILQSAEHEGGEGLGEGDGGAEVGGGELVGARRRGEGAEFGQDVVGVDSVELFLLWGGLAFMIYQAGRGGKWAYSFNCY